LWCLPSLTRGRVCNLHCVQWLMRIAQGHAHVFISSMNKVGQLYQELKLIKINYWICLAKLKTISLVTSLARKEAVGQSDRQFEFW
jgi:hypothetical protein